MVDKLKMIVMYVNILIVGLKLQSILNELTLQKELQNSITNIFGQKSKNITTTKQKKQTYLML